MTILGKGNLSEDSHLYMFENEANFYDGHCQNYQK
jgi:hypothetical protein